MFTYPCPDCRTESNLHGWDCRFDDVDRATVEQAYTDILSVLITSPTPRKSLRAASPGGWDELHEAALGTLTAETRVVTTPADRPGGSQLKLLTPEERREEVSEPTVEPIKTIYEKGSVPGAHDNAVFALVSFFEMVGLDWKETREKVLAWLDESGTWARGGFDESDPEQVVDAKRRIHERGYGWKEKAEAAKRVIDQELVV